MNLFSRIAIGTANWGQEYNGARVSDHDQQEIIGYAQCSGITTIDTATAYGVDWTKWPTCFDVVVKVGKGDNIKAICETQPYCVMAHGMTEYGGVFNQLHDYGRWTGAFGVSVYAPSFTEQSMPSVVQFPYSLFDRRCEQWMYEAALYEESGYDSPEIHVRSIFLRGKILEAGVSPEECVKFCLCNPNVDKVIVGADSFEQFRQSVGWIHEWNTMQKHDEKLLDPRQWGMETNLESFEKATEIHKET